MSTRGFDSDPAGEPGGGAGEGAESGLDAEAGLETELRALFDDDRLALRPRVGARHDILRGVRRRRRRRTALTGGGTALAVMAVAGAVLSIEAARSRDESSEAPLAASGSAGQTRQTVTAAGSAALPPVGTPGAPHPTEQPPWQEGSHAVTTAPSPRSSPGRAGETAAPPMQDKSLVTGPVLRHDGYRALELGMPYRQAVRTDLLRDSGDAPAPERCVSYALVEGDDAVRHVTISEADGVVAFVATGARTADGVGVGTPAERVRAVYPEVRREGPEYVVSTGAGDYRFAMRDGVVTDLRLTSPQSDC